MLARTRRRAARHLIVRVLHMSMSVRMRAFADPDDVAWRLPCILGHRAAPAVFECDASHWRKVRPRQSHRVRARPPEDSARCAGSCRFITHTTTWPAAGCRSGPSPGLPPPRCASARRTLTTCLPPPAPNPTRPHARALRLLVDGDSCPECQHQVLHVVASTAAPMSARRCSLAPWIACTRAPVALALS